MSSSPINVSVVGIGMSATVFHIPFIQALPEQFKLHSIVERKATSEKSDARDFYGPDIKVVTSLQEVLEDDVVDAVFVTTINDTHYEFSKAILTAGKHVIIEKPLTPTAAESKELIDLAKSTNLIIAVFQNRRWDADFLTVKHLYETGQFGELSHFESYFDRYRNNLAPSRQWKETPGPGSGAAFDLGSHLLDQALYLFGRPDSVTATLRNSRGLGHADFHDSFIIQLNYPAKENQTGRKIPLLVTLGGSILSLFNPQLRYRIKGTDAAFVKYGVDVQEPQSVASGYWQGPPKADVPKPGDDAFGREPKEAWGTIYTAEKKDGEVVESKQGSYLDWFKNVAGAIQKKDPELLIVKPEQAAEVIEIIEACLKSSQEGITVKL
ncbi:Predicted oxidoreductase [Phaffia rhodozyma]|uniref:Predicted oxidoreductase n=1 Tax=Phaffia rhodozyma TaxID=264483 RepID=A0A0F7SSW9_PHARH|nr:Predicted oxidoreductase [Phaffia rhodozyma]